MSEFPSGKLERTGILAKTGLKIGGNYAKYHLKKAFGDQTASKEDVHRESAQQLFKELTNLRGTALKLAQSISMDQSGLLPDTYVEIMTGAQYKVPPINKAMVRKTASRLSTRMLSLLRRSVRSTRLPLHRVRV